jgi:autotransporter-associated beta strand protein
VSGNNTLILIGANTYTGKTFITSGTLQLGEVFPSRARLGNGDVNLAAGATLRIKGNVVDGIPDTATLTLRNAGDAFNAKLELETGINETVSGLVIDGKALPAGTYGGKESNAANKLEKYFSGAGVLTVKPN